MDDVLYIVIPCYNEQEVLPETARRIGEKIGGLIEDGKYRTAAGWYLLTMGPGTIP